MHVFCAICIYAGAGDIGIALSSVSSDVIVLSFSKNGFTDSIQILFVAVTQQLKVFPILS